MSSAHGFATLLNFFKVDNYGFQTCLDKIIASLLKAELITEVEIFDLKLAFSAIHDFQQRSEKCQLTDKI